MIEDTDEVPPIHTELSEGIFVEKYKPEENDDGSIYVQRHYDNPIDRKALEIAQVENRIWTMKEEDEKWILCNYPAYINRLYYVITANAYDPEEIITVDCS